MAKFYFVKKLLSYITQSIIKFERKLFNFFLPIWINDLLYYVAQNTPAWIAIQTGVECVHTCQYFGICVLERSDNILKAAQNEPVNAETNDGNEANNFAYLGQKWNDLHPFRTDAID